MTVAVRNQKDLAAGSIYVAAALAVLWINRGYEFGDRTDIGPGFFPFCLAVVLLGVGLLTTAKAFAGAGEPLPGLSWRPLVMVTASVVVFVTSLGPLGLPFAVTAAALIAVLAQPGGRVTLRTVAGAAVLALTCTLIFVLALGIRMPVLGSWLAG